jgi:hypothetical protein
MQNNKVLILNTISRPSNPYTACVAYIQDMVSEKIGSLKIFIIISELPVILRIILRKILPDASPGVFERFHLICCMSGVKQ